MRKLATLAALTLGTGTVLAGGAMTANAAVGGDPIPEVTTVPHPGMLDFIDTFCGPPWEWTDHGTCDNPYGPPFMQ